MNNQIDIIQAVAAANVVMDINHNQLVPRHRTVCQDGTLITATSNQELLQRHFSDQAPLTISPAHVAQAHEQIQQLQHRQLMTLISPAQTKPTAFLYKIFKLVGQHHVRIQDMGLVAWIPKLVRDLNQTDDTRIQIRNVCADSVWLPRPVVGPIRLRFSPFITRYNKQYSSYFHDGHDGAGNRVQFWHRTAMKTSGMIRCKIKDHVTRDTVKVTVLSYVNIIKE